MTTEPIKDLGGQPAPEGYESWKDYILRNAKLRDWVKWSAERYTTDDCDYVVFTDGSMVKRSAEAAQGIMQRIRMETGRAVLQDMRDLYETMNRETDRWQEREVCSKCGGETEEGLLHTCVK